MRKCRPFDELKPAQQRRRMRRDAALGKFAEHIEKPIQPVPEKETECERRIRLLEDVSERARLYEKAGLVEKGEENRLHWYLQQRLEKLLVEARRELRFERGDF